MEEAIHTTESPTDSTACASDLPACAAYDSCGSCASGLCPGVLAAGAIALLWIGILIGGKLLGKKPQSNAADEPPAGS